ncbi:MULTISPECIES: hypothetical protein [unclassified Proteiniphilum]|jgi:hypothetical protein|uniref:hypothetical protein n=1 Tax=unclassified Proteiniphilum TaxID=2622718 RepID=UPI002579C593|nr:MULTISPECIES: hypothetical protein [unclassified Proteiniphilum]
MKKEIHKSLFLSILIFISGCNSDIFVEDFLPGEQMDVVLSETDNRKEINFKSDNWRLIDIVSFMDAPFTTRAYTLDGEPVSFPFGEKEPATVYCLSDFIDFRVEKRGGNKLQLTLNENLMNEDVTMLIKVGNDYKEQQIKLLLAPTSKYQIDSVVYDWEKFEINEGALNEMESLVVDNKNSSSPVTLTCYPFKKSTRKILFYNPAGYWDEQKFRRLLGATLPEIAIPDLVDSKPVLHNTKASFGIMEQELEAPLDKKLSVEVTVDAYDKRKILIFNEVERYSVPYKVYISNPKTGKKRFFTGELTSSRPTDYFILKTKVE